MFKPLTIQRPLRRLIRMFTPTDDGTLHALFKDACDSYSQELEAQLLAAGFNDIPRNELLVLLAIAIPRIPAANLIRVLGISEQATSGVINTLVMRGYLELKASPDGRRRLSMQVTERGYAVIGVVMDSIIGARWANFPFRSGDIVISAPVKSGTTWLQMICALLVFQTQDLPAPLSRLSPWLDSTAASRDEIYSLLSDQQNRRVIKTHTQLDKVVIDPRATYLVVARHPLDLAISLYHQADNLGGADIAPSASKLERDRPRPPLRQWLVEWIDADGPSQDRQASLANVMWHLSDAWGRRHEQNIVLVHYEDLSADLEGEMRRLAARLDITIPDETWPSLVKAATFDQMRADADRIQPLGGLKDNAAFFRSGISGAGLALLSRDEIARYELRTAQLASADMLAWLHRQGEQNRPGIEE
jgi:aryl sulfotransferase